MLRKKREKLKIRKNNRKTNDSKIRNSNQIIGIWGSPGAGKTTTAIKLAKALANMKYNVILVHDDQACPVIPTIINDPKGKQRGKSLGNIFLNNSEQKIIKDNLITVEESKHLALLGYGKGENYNSYPKYVEEKVDDLLIQLRHLADYIIIDCSSNLNGNIFIKRALENADRIISIASANLKALSYYNSNLPILINSISDMSKQLVVISNTKNYQAKETINDLLKGRGIYLEHIEEITKQYAEKKIFGDLKEKKNDSYKENINRIIEELIYD